LDLGFEKAGFEPLVAVEVDRDSVATLRRNRAWPVIGDDIHRVASSAILTAADVREGDVDVLIGGPPCQPFSKSAYWRNGDTKRLEDPRASTLEQFLRLVRDMKPRAFLLENVPGLGYHGKDEGQRRITELIASINEETGTSYRLSSAVIDAAEFGVPQRRRRLFIVGSREGIEFRFPAPTHRPAQMNGELASALPPFLTAWDAIGDLDGKKRDPALMVRGRWGGLLPSIPEGHNYLYHTNRGEGLPLFGWRTRFWSFLLKLAKDQPSPTLTASPGPATGPFHWKNRRLTVQELLRLQTFPDGYEIAGGRTSAQRQLGNAVPPALAQKLAIEIRAQLLGDRHARKRRAGFQITPRAEVPRRERVRRVSPEYLDLVGVHPAHPGPGLGPGILARAE
jgi:DNA (cytosine-5)-methyltransferase 1